VKSPRLHIQVFSDARPGHEIQSLTLAKKIQSLAASREKTATDRVCVSLHRFAIRQPWLSFAPRVLPRFGRHVLWTGDSPAINTPAHLVITCGRRAAAVGKWFCLQQRARGFQPAHVQILHPGDSPSHYDFLLLPQHDLRPHHPRPANVITFHGCLHPVGATWLHQQKKKWEPRFAPLKQMDSPLVGVLLGNPGIKFFTRQLMPIKQQLQQWQPHSRFVVAASKRTPQTAKSAIAAAFTDAEILWLDETDGDNPYAGILAWADAFAVTADSINMLAEASATGKPVRPLALAAISPKHQRFVRSLQNRNEPPKTSTEKIAVKILDRIDS